MLLQALSLVLKKLIKLTLRLNNNNSSLAKNKGTAVVVVDVVMAMDTATVARTVVALEVSDSSLELLMRAKEDVTEVKEVENGKSLLVK
jgi:predicted ATP-binding protein involved in virulence